MNLIPPTVVFDSYFRYVWQFSNAVHALIGRATVGRQPMVLVSQKGRYREVCKLLQVNSIHPTL